MEMLVRQQVVHIILKWRRLPIEPPQHDGESDNALVPSLVDGGAIEDSSDAWSDDELEVIPDSGADIIDELRLEVSGDIIFGNSAEMILATGEVYHMPQTAQGMAQGMAISQREYIQRINDAYLVEIE